MRPRKPMLDRLYFDSDGEEKVLDFEKSVEDQGFYTSGTAEERALRHAIRSPRAVFDAGWLPEITIRPPKDNAVYKVNYMIPNKELRDQFYNSINRYDGYFDDDTKDTRTYINRLWELYKKSQKPTIKNIRNSVLNPVRIYQKIRGGDVDRPNYDNFTNTMYISPEYAAEDIEAELAHAYQFYGTDMPRKYGFLRNFLSLPGDIEISGKSGYQRPGNIEFDAHSIIEPLFNRYLTDPKVNYQDIYDIMMDAYENPNSYFKKINKGLFSGSLKQIRPLSK